MTPMRITLAVLGAALTFVLAACGGASDVPTGSVAVVAGTEISQAELDEMIETARKGYKAREQEFPKVGTPEYQDLQRYYVAFLVQWTEFEQAAEDLGLEVTETDIDKAIEDDVKGRFDGDRDEFDKALEEQGYDEESTRKIIYRVAVLSKKIFDEVTKDVKVEDADLLAYYTQNQASYGTPESREVRHILIAEQGKNGQVDFAKSKEEADRIYAELQAGAAFASLAKEFSDDPGTKSQGGKLTINRGETVAEFDSTAFSLAEAKISKPVKTQYGYHVIEALSPVKPAKTTPFALVKDTIKASLLQQKRNEVMTAWVEDLRKDYESKVKYASGFEPPDLPETPTETQ